MVTVGEEALRTGELAASAGVNVQTLRYYERRGLLPEPGRLPSGYREYPPEAARRLRFIKRAQELGFTLREVAELLRLHDVQDASCAAVRSAAQDKIAGIDRKLQSLRAMKRALTELVESCSGQGAARRCPILESLERAGDVPRKRLGREARR